MKTINSCNCNRQFLDFICAAIEQSELEVQLVNIKYCGPESIYLNLVFYDKDILKDNGEYGEWIEREFLLRYSQNSSRNLIQYILTRGLDSDGELVHQGTYAYQEGFPQSGVEYCMDKNYVYWDLIDGAVEELVDYMIQQSETPLEYDSDEYDDPDEYSVPTEVLVPIACDVRDFLVNLLQKEYGCYFPPLEV